MKQGERLNTDVVVAGAGVAGSALAYELSVRGVNVILLERGANGPAGASAVPAALINPHRGRTARAKPLDLAGTAAFWQLVSRLEQSGASSGAHRSGVLRLADNPRQAKAWQKLGGTVWLEPNEVPPAYHAPHGGLLVPEGGWLRSRALLAALVTAAQAGPARPLTGVELLGVSHDSAHTPGARYTADLRAKVRTAGEEDGEFTIGCRALVVATGALQPADLALPRLELVRGEARVLDLGFTPPLPLAGGVVAAFAEGAAYVTGGHRHAGWLGQPPKAGADHDEASPDLRRALGWHVPGAGGAKVVESWSGVRAKRPSGEPVARLMGAGVYFLGAFGGRGFLRAALVAGRLADALAARLR